MVNLSKLNDIPSFSFNETILNDSTNITGELVNVANTQSEGNLGLLIMTALYIWLMYLLMKEDGFANLDFVKSSVIASGLSLIAGIVMIVSTLITSYVHVVWFLTIFVLSLVASYFLKEKGL